jgi:hypothetical protein
VRGALLQALIHSAAFAAAALWAFDVGYRVAGAWLGMLMGFQAGLFAVMLLSGAPSWWARWSRSAPRRTRDHLIG